MIQIECPFHQNGVAFRRRGATIYVGASWPPTASVLTTAGSANRHVLGFAVRPDNPLLRVGIELRS